MSGVLKHWDSKALILLGKWLWREKEYGHALLCMHAPFWGFKIGQQLRVSWDDVMDTNSKECYVELNLPDKDIYPRPINFFIKESIEKAYSQLDVENVEDVLYMNYKTGKPLTSSTLNRELQRFSEKFLAEIKSKTGIDLNYKPLKTNAFEIAWALDLIKKNNATPMVFKLVSEFMGHRTVKDTAKLLEVEPVTTILLDFDLIKGIDTLTEKVLDDKDALYQFITSKIIYQDQEFIPII